MDIRVLCIWRKSGHRFKQNDYEILKQAFSVTLLYFTYSPICIVKMLYLMCRHDIAYCWFGNVWAFFMVLFGKICRTKTVIVAGGHDVANVEDINYGLVRHPVLKHFARIAMTNADMVLSVSEYNRGELLKFVTPKRNALVYNCCNETVIEHSSSSRKNRVITAGQIDRKSCSRKGYFEFLQVAGHLPDIEFLHIGKAKDQTIEKLQGMAPANVTYTGYLPDEEYAKVLGESKVYLQLSKHEAFGVSVVEAMLHGCTAVVSNKAALPEIVGSAGVIVDPDDPEKIAERIRLILENCDNNEKAVERAKEFSLKRRADRLVPIIRELVEER